MVCHQQIQNFFRVSSMRTLCAQRRFLSPNRYRASLIAYVPRLARVSDTFQISKLSSKWLKMRKTGGRGLVCLNVWIYYENVIHISHITPALCHSRLLQYWSFLIIPRMPRLDWVRGSWTLLIKTTDHSATRAGSLAKMCELSTYTVLGARSWSVIVWESFVRSFIHKTCEVIAIYLFQEKYSFMF